MAQRTYIQPGPRDDSLLTEQARHRSHAIWNAQAQINEDEPLRCQRDGSMLHGPQIDQRIEPYVRASGFYGVWKMGFWQIDHHLITALVERWRPETHTFHMPEGECTVTLQDIAILTGLPIDGDAVTCPTRHSWPDLCQELLGDRPPQNQMRASMVKIRWLRERFGQIPADADEQTIVRYARAFILQLAGGSIFSDKSGARVSLMFLPLLANLDEPTPYSWGAAALAWLYRELCNATDPEAHQISGALHVLQIWAWDRFSCVSPSIISHASLPDAPLGSRWTQPLQTTLVPTHTLRHLRYQFDRMSFGDITWEPYTDDIIQDLPDYCLQDQDIWRARVPLIYFHIVEWHYPDRVLRQFGMKQSIPIPPHDHTAFHSIQLKPIDKNWVAFHGEWIGIWNNRGDHIVTNDFAMAPLSYHSAYMKWYRKHTRKWISVTGGAVGRACDGAEQILRVLPTISPQNIEENIPVIEKICKAMLHAFGEERRLISSSGSTAAHIGPTADETPDTVQSTRMPSPSRLVDDPVPYPSAYHTPDFTPGFASGFSQFASPYHHGSDFTPVNSPSSYGAEFFQYPSAGGYVPSEHDIFQGFHHGSSSQAPFIPDEGPSSSAHPDHAEPQRRYNTRTAQERRPPRCGTGGHRGGRHHH